MTLVFLLFPLSSGLCPRLHNPVEMGFYFPRREVATAAAAVGQARHIPYFELKPSRNDSSSSLGGWLAGVPKLNPAAVLSEVPDFVAGAGAGAGVGTGEKGPLACAFGAAAWRSFCGLPTNTDNRPFIFAGALSPGPLTQNTIS